MTRPTIGRVVHVHNRPGALSSGTPEAAMIVFVHNPDLINVGGWDHSGKPFSILNVEFRQEGDPMRPPSYAWAQFPPRF